MRNNARYDVWIVPETHWDRAWYFPFEGFRARLVEMFDKLLDILDNDPSYRAFSFDGQTVVLEDYLQVRPENRARIERHVRGGRLAIGPWYVMPDAYLVSAEALVRNLQTGRRIARSFGRCMNAGYIPDPFGYPAAMPSILAGFGVDSFIFMRGAGPRVQKLGPVFRWIAPDDSWVVATRQIGGYCNLCGWGVPRGHPVDSPVVDTGPAMERFGRLIETMEREGLNVNTVLMNNGCDHHPAQPTIPTLVAEARRRFRGLRVRQGTFEDYVNALRLEKPMLKQYRGELHSGWKGSILSGTFSARMWIKQENFFCQRLLEQGAEPLDALMAALRLEGRSPYVAYAWNELIKNHPHDDICGCSVDAVHQDNGERFRHVRQAGGETVRISFERLCRRVTFEDAVKPGAWGIMAFNPAPVNRGAQIVFDLPDEMKTDAAHVAVKRGDGVMLPAERCGRRFRFYDVNMPALGYATYTVVENRLVASAHELRAHTNTIENRFLRAALNRDGTVDLHVKGTGKTWRGLNLLEDSADAGDEYDYAPLRGGPKPVLSAGARGTMTPARLGPECAEVSVTLSLRLPAGLNAGRTARSRETAAVAVTVTVRLRPGSRLVEFTTVVANTARDHRLRVLFPSGIRTRTVLASSHFDVIRRPLRPSDGAAAKQRLPVNTHHMDEFVAAQDRTGGLMVAACGLPEYEALEERHGVTLALTLLRCCGWLSLPGLSTRPGNAGPQWPAPGAQCLDTYTFEYAVEAYEGDVVTSGAAQDGRLFTTPAVCRAMNLRPFEPRPVKKTLPPVHGFAHLDRPELALSAFKRAESGAGIIARIYNMSARPVKGNLTLDIPFTRVGMTRIDETPHGGPVKVSGRTIALAMKGKQIVTLLIR